MSRSIKAREAQPKESTTRVPIFFPDSYVEKMKNRKGTTGVPVAEQVRQAVEKDLSGDSVRKVPLLGYIPASPASTVVPIHGAFVDLPPHAPNLEADYALIVTGQSMECEDETIPDGAYAYFVATNRGIPPRPRDIVHVEFIDDANSDNDLTLAIYKPQADGSVIFDKCNKDFKPIVRKPGEKFEIRGIFLMPYKDTGKEG